MTDDLNAAPDAHTGEMTSIPEPAEIDALLPDYDVQSVLGQGGMGAVYKAWQPRLGRPVAIKVLPTGVGEHLQFSESFRREACTMANLNHSHIVTVHDFGEVEGFLYLVMEYVDGETLFHRLHEGTLDNDKIIAIILQVCDALAYAHGQNVVHRDIKSANILLGNDGMAKVVDFGLATLQGAPGQLRRNVQTGPIMGTPGYSAPEILKPGATVDQRADIYSLGVVLYEALTGRTMEDAWSPPSRIAGTPPQLDSIILKATRTDPSERYQSVDQFAASIRQLKRFGSGRPKNKVPRKVAVTAVRAPAPAARVAAAPARAPLAAAVPASASGPASAPAPGPSIPARTAPLPPRPVAPVRSGSDPTPIVIGVVVVAILVAILLLSGKKPQAPTPPPKKTPDPLVEPTLPAERS